MKVKMKTEIFKYLEVGETQAVVTCTDQDINERHKSKASNYIG